MPPLHGPIITCGYEAHYFPVGLKKNAYLLEVQFHFEIDAQYLQHLKSVITIIFSTLQVILNTRNQALLAWF